MWVTVIVNCCGFGAWWTGHSVSIPRNYPVDVCASSILLLKGNVRWWWDNWAVFVGKARWYEIPPVTAVGLLAFRSWRWASAHPSPLGLQNIPTLFCAGKGQIRGILRLRSVCFLKTCHKLMSSFQKSHHNDGTEWHLPGSLSEVAKEWMGWRNLPAASVETSGRQGCVGLMVWRLWSEAGLLSWRLCHSHFHCSQSSGRVFVVVVLLLFVFNNKN